jgi:hypothetical protein
MVKLIGPDLRMHVSCLTITQPGRLAFFLRALGDFVAQTHAERDLLVLHDGGAALQGELEAAVRQQAPAALWPAIRIEAAAPGQTLGALRNRSLDAATGPLVCQWDDDDRFHPLRLALQLQALRAQQADACFLADQLHLFAQRRELTWDDWDAEPYPLNLVPGTLLARRDALPRYPETARGEDTALVLGLLAGGRPIARLRHAGWSYVYTYHGANTWPMGHHQSVARGKPRSAALVVGALAGLRSRLAEYAGPVEADTLAHPLGVVALR